MGKLSRSKLVITPRTKMNSRDKKGNSRNRRNTDRAEEAEGESKRTRSKKATGDPRKCLSRGSSSNNPSRSNNTWINNSYLNTKVFLQVRHNRYKIFRTITTLKQDRKSTNLLVIKTTTTNSVAPKIRPFSTCLINKMTSLWWSLNLFLLWKWTRSHSTCLRKVRSMNCRIKCKIYHWLSILRSKSKWTNFSLDALVQGIFTVFLLMHIYTSLSPFGILKYL